jgi:hypothetical protein
MANGKPFSLDAQGNLIQSNAVDDILNSPSVSVVEPPQTGSVSVVKPSPTNVPGQTPQQAATGVKTTPKVSATPAPAVAPTPKVLTDKEKLGLNAAYQRKLNGTANADDVANIDYAVKNNLWAEPSSVADKMAGAFSEKSPFELGTGIEGYDKALADKKVTQPAEDKWAVPSFDSILSGMGIEKLTAKDYSGDYQALEDNLTAQLEQIDLQYQQDYDDLVKQNKQATADLRAKLKKGKFLSNSIDNAVAGQEARNQEALDKLERAMNQDKGAAKQNKTANYMALSKQERDDYFNVQSANINNVLQGYNTATNVWNVFSSRSTEEKKMEQDAYQFLVEQSNNAMEADLERTQSFIEKGLYDVYDEDVVKMLNSLEKSSGLELNSLVNAATGGYWDRMSNMSLKDAQAENLAANTEKTKTLLPLEVQKYQADIANVQSTIAKRLSESKEAGSQEANSLLQGSSAKLLEEAKGNDGYYDSSKYVQVMNEFISEVDPKLTNEKYYSDLFMNYLPPTKLLNPSEDDKSAAKLRSEFTKSLKLEDLLGM